MKHTAVNQSLQSWESSMVVFFKSFLAAPFGDIILGIRLSSPVKSDLASSDLRVG